MYSSYAYQTPAGEGEFYTYDRMGNITQLMRDHRKSHVNALYATYSGNQLLSVYDGGLPNTDYDYQTYPNLSDAEQEYYYDAEGNQTVNLDKNIVATRYNLLNLPDTIQFGNGNRIINYYLSGGEGVRTVSRTYTTPLSVPLDAVTNSTDPYIEHTETRTGSWICQDGSPDRLLCSGGYLKVSKKSGSVGLDFHPFSYICDYLGSVRLVCDGKTGEVLQSLEYLPSGLIFRSSNYDFQPNKYTGKELLSMHGLNQYDSQARMQEFQFPIFTTRDPLCEKYYDISPYAYCANTPMRYVDPDGRKIVIGSILGRVAAFFGVDNFESQVQQQLSELKDLSPTLKKTITALENSDKIVHIKQTSEGNATQRQYNNPKVKQGSTIFYNSESWKASKDNVRPPTVGLAHELGHAEDLVNGKALGYDREAARNGTDAQEVIKGNQNERNAIDKENAVRKVLKLEIRSYDYYPRK